MAETLKVKTKEVVVPGEIMAEGMGFLPSRGTYRDNSFIRASMLGMVGVDGKVIRITPLSGVYIPKTNDKVIGKVIDVLMTGWRLDIQGPYSAVMGLKDATSEFIPRNADLRQYYNLGDYVYCKITKVTSQKLVDVSMRGPGFRKLKGGRIIELSPKKVPRIIGREGSMTAMIKNATGCNMLVGQNGLIWVNGEPEKEIIAVEAVRKIEQETHKSGLTDEIKAFLEKKTGAPVKEAQAGPVKAEPKEQKQKSRRTR